MLYRDPKSILQLKINEALGKQEETIVTDLIKLSMLKRASKNQDALQITEVYNLLGLENFTALINLLDGKSLILPNKEDFKDTLLTVLVYYYRDVEGLDWAEIKDKLGIEVNSVKFGIKASQFGSFLKEMVSKRLK